MNSKDFYIFYRIKYRNTTHYRDNIRFFNIKEHCNWCIANNTFFKSQNYNKFKEWVNKNYILRDKYNKIVKEFKLNCSCSQDFDVCKDVSKKDFLEVLNMYVNYLYEIKKINLWKYKNDFFIEALEKVKLTEYKNIFNDNLIFTFYDLEIKDNIKKYLLETIKMKVGHMARLIRYYEYQLKK